MRVVSHESKMMQGPALRELHLTRGRSPQNRVPTSDAGPCFAVSIAAIAHQS